mmetsp:Transcript_158/g.405  ORF Transcript_158/g.405 Transcript_158/m.405 type:complete len:143 (-) Transcript_158:299-727(-)|eukprot:CAMPEP_0118925576 /NCGR_PEP_ID=MMETSP1169-20130426/3444_1 /TAXON_ID=36882 /ORGANISM="Pyramimonas obovata, Strain CCMP722" /LENGTH=142 /DNA_ID=CAMNT_0006866911 /DNA_START=304 /DNA_END=732 /DNA_ORIENTATION=-
MAPPTYQQLAELGPEQDGITPSSLEMGHAGEGYDTNDYMARQAKRDRIKLIISACIVFALAVAVIWVFADPHVKRSRSKFYAETFPPPGYLGNPHGWVQVVPKGRSLENPHKPPAPPHTPPRPPPLPPKPPKAPGSSGWWGK